MWLVLTFVSGSGAVVSLLLQVLEVFVEAL
jgi:hypothetical protein